MIEIGKWNKLSVVKKVEFGVFLDGFEDGEILLPQRYVPEVCEVDDELDVFIHFDSDDRLVATTEKPLAIVGEFALLKVAGTTSVGAFLNWGLPKDLFLPFAEQSREVRTGQDVLVFVYTDKSDRLAASMRLDRNMSKVAGTYTEGQAVNLIIAGKTDLGFKAIVEGQHWGVLYSNEVFQELQYGQRLSAFIKKLRPDGKIDLALSMTTGHKAAADIGPQILELLQAKGGFLALNDKTPPEEIQRLFGVSKKKYKIALGGLYKKRQISVDDDGIRLLPAK